MKSICVIIKKTISLFFTNFHLQREMYHLHNTIIIGSVGNTVGVGCSSTNSDEMLQ